MSDLDKRHRSTGLVSALQDLTDGFYTLLREHLELVRLEVEHEARSTGRRVAALVILGSISLVGYGLLNVAAILFASWFGGRLAMAAAALVLGVANLWISLSAIRRVVEEMKSSEEPSFSQTRQELSRSKQWLQEIRETSNDHPEAETS